VARIRALVEAGRQALALRGVPQRGLDVVGAELRADGEQGLHVARADPLVVRGVGAVEQAAVGLLDLVAVLAIARVEREVREQIELVSDRERAGPPGGAGLRVAHGVRDLAARPRCLAALSRIDGLAIPTSRRLIPPCPVSGEPAAIQTVGPSTLSIVFSSSAPAV